MSTDNEFKNINDYLNSDSANKTFSQQSYNEIDALVFSTLAYFPMDEVVPGITDKKEITIEKFISEIEKNGMLENYLKVKGEKDAPKFKAFTELLKNSDRYKDITLGNFSNKFSTQNEEQFAAVTINLPGGSSVVSFRGTDGTVAGWKEDFNLAFSTEVPAQTDAKAYLNMVAEKISDGDIYVTGHSKGGHLAIYSSLTCDDEVRDRIKNIYNFDGPGIRNDIMYKYSDQYQQIKDKIIAYVPESSMIGMLLTDHKNLEHVESSASGIMQHDQFSWGFDKDGKFVICPNNRPDELSIFINNTLDDMLDSLSLREREVLIDTIFMLGTQGGEQSFNDIFSTYKEYFKDGDVIKGISKILTDINNLDIEQKEVLLRTVSMLMLVAVDNGAIDYARAGVDKWAIDTKKEINEKFDSFMRWGTWVGLNPLIVKLAEKLCEALVDKVNDSIHSILTFIERRIKGDSGGCADYGALQVNLSNMSIIIQRLSSIHNRIMRLDDELNYLRDSLEWYEIIDKLRVSGVDFLYVGYDSDLKKCIDYLNFTVEKLTACENRLYQDSRAI